MEVEAFAAWASAAFSSAYFRYEAVPSADAICPSLLSHRLFHAFRSLVQHCQLLCRASPLVYCLSSNL